MKIIQVLLRLLIHLTKNDKEPTLEKSKRFDSCFRKIPKFLDKTNIIEIFN